MGEQAEVVLVTSSPVATVAARSASTAAGAASSVVVALVARTLAAAAAGAIGSRGSSQVAMQVPPHCDSVSEAAESEAADRSRRLPKNFTASALPFGKHLHAE